VEDTLTNSGGSAFVQELCIYIALQFIQNHLQEMITALYERRVPTDWFKIVPGLQAMLRTSPEFVEEALIERSKANCKKDATDPMEKDLDYFKETIRER
jgi:hypothetical protein